MAPRVVTLPPAERGGAAIAFVGRARACGAAVIEVRNDLHGPRDVDLEALAREAPVLISERRGALPAAWIEMAWKVDLPVRAAVTSGVPPEKILWSHHAPAPMSADEAAAWWSPVPATAAVKHVEPVGSLAEGSRIFATQRALNSRFSYATTLLVGADALPFRAVAATSNALDYVAFGSDWSAAPGQRMLADAVRSNEASTAARLGIIGTSLAASRSPRVHVQPFDRIDLPAQTDVAALLNTLLPHWRGLAVTSPFKKRSAEAVGAELPSINCLYRVDGRWRSANTDIDGARVALKRLGAASVQALGDGGATEALRLAAPMESVRLTVSRRSELAGTRVVGACIWTWPEAVEPPAGMTFAPKTDVGLIAYGGRARRIAAKVRALGGRPRYLGAAWFCAQARAQRFLWESAA